MRRFVAGLLLGLFLAAVLPVHAIDIQPRSRAFLALQSSVSLVVGLLDAYASVCGGVALSPTTVLTAAHCLDGPDDLAKTRIRTMGGQQTAILRALKTDTRRDLILVQTAQPMLNVRPAVVEDNVAIGDAVRLVGSPGGFGFMVTKGIISRIQDYAFDNCEADDQTGRAKQQVFLTDALSWGGSSGGGVFNDDGNLVGILVRARILATGDCDQYTPTGVLWAYAVGPAALQTFLEGTP